MATKWCVFGASILALAIAGCSEDSCPTCVDTAIRGFALYYDGAPIPGARVEITGKPTVLTGPDGSFVVTHVEPPYDIALLQSSVQVWRGLTRRDPVLYSLSGPGTRLLAAQVSGHVPVVPGTSTEVFFISPGARQWVVAKPLTGEYRLDLHWFEGAPAQAGRLCVLRWSHTASGLQIADSFERGPGRPTAYNAWAEIELTIAAGEKVDRDFVAADLEDPRDATISGHLDLPDGHVLNDLALNVRFGEQQVPIVNAVGGVDGNGDFKFVVPDLPSASLEVLASSRRFEGASHGYSQVVETLPHGTQSLLLRLKSTPALSAPLPDTADVDGATSFSWMPGGGDGIYLFAIRQADYSSEAYVLQADASLQLEEIPVLHLAADTPYDWYVRQLLPVPDTDAAAAPGIIPVLYARQDESASEVRGFRTQP